ncbi:MAG: hypothetical protein V4481_04310 [Patescibacteria group bacterium]
MSMKIGITRDPRTGTIEVYGKITSKKEFAALTRGMTGRAFDVVDLPKGMSKSDRKLLRAFEELFLRDDRRGMPNQFRRIWDHAIAKAYSAALKKGEDEMIEKLARAAS